MELIGNGLYALLPAGRAGPAGALGTIEGLAARLRAYGPTGTSSRYADAAEIGRAMREAELVLEALAGDSPAARALDGTADRASTGCCSGCSPRAPKRCAASTRTRSRRSCATTSSTAAHLLPTLAAYLGNDCNMNATARAIYAHRHTVAYRLERVRELTGLDPTAHGGPRTPRPRAQGAADRGSTATTRPIIAPGGKPADFAASFGPR